MTDARETLVAELWRRLSSATGVVYSSRNPVSPPNVDLLPAVQFFELEDRVVEKRMRGSYPAYKRELTVAIEGFIVPTSDELASKEILAFIDTLKKKIYTGGVTLGRLAQDMEETEASRVLRPPVEDLVVGMGIVLKIRYIEDIADLM